jgi:hypothetical protein
LGSRRTDDKSRCKKNAIEFREKGVDYGGAAIFSAWHPFDREELPALLLELAKLLKDWPVAALQLRLDVPPDVQKKFDDWFYTGRLRATCVALDTDANEILREDVLVRRIHGQFVVPFWVKPDPDLSIDIEIFYDPAYRLACKGILPAVCVAPLRRI